MDIITDLERKYFEQQDRGKAWAYFYQTTPKSIFSFQIYNVLVAKSRSDAFAQIHWAAKDINDTSFPSSLHEITYRRFVQEVKSHVGGGSAHDDVLEFIVRNWDSK